MSAYETLLARGEARGIEKGIEQGIEKGKVEGQRELLLKQLTLKFGPLDDDAQARVRAATPEDLICWAERVLAADRLDLVFAR